MRAGARRRRRRGLVAAGATARLVACGFLAFRRLAFGVRPVFRVRCARTGALHFVPLLALLPLLALFGLFGPFALFAFGRGLLVLLRVIGDVEAAPLELDGRRREQFAHRARAADRARVGRRIGKSSNQFKPTAAGVAFILVQGHGRRSYSSTSPAASPSSNRRWSQKGAVPWPRSVS